MVSFSVVTGRVMSAEPGTTCEKGYAEPDKRDRLIRHQRHHRYRGTTELKVDEAACHQRGIGPRRPEKKPQDPMNNRYRKEKKGR